MTGVGGRRFTPILAVLLVAALAALGVLAGTQATGLLGPGRGAAPAATHASPGSATSGAPASAAAGLAGATPSPVHSPTPAPRVESVVDGVLVPAAQSVKATRVPIAVMIDDHPDARPQSGLSSADLVYQAPAEGGIPRYMAVFQSGDAKAIGPIRSARRYFAGWAAEWRALYAHVGGAPNALAWVRGAGASLVTDADEYSWASYMPRIATRVAPHNVYSSTTQLRKLASRLDAKGGIADAPWTFGDETPEALRPYGGTLTVSYPYNLVGYRYDRTTNRYPRTVSGGTPDVDAANGKRIAPANVIVQYVEVGALANAPGQTTNEFKGRLELGYIGSGKALVLCNGKVYQARWSKVSDEAPTLFTYAKGSRAGQPVALVRGQVYIQVVPLDAPVKAVAGHSTPAPAGLAR